MTGDEKGWKRRPITKVGPDTPSGAGSRDPATAYLEQLGPGSRRTMREALDKLADWASAGRCGAHDLPWHLLELEHTAALRTRLGATLAPATANKHMAALRGVLRQCWLQGSLTQETFRRVTDLPPLRGDSPRRSPGLRAEEFERLTRVCIDDDKPSGARDAALLSLLRSPCLRRAEAVALDLADYDPANGTLRIRTSGRETKGTARRLAVPAPGRRALDRWILIRGLEPGPLFYPINKGGRIERRRLSEQAIYIACQKRASEAGLPPTSPEDLRRVRSEAREASA
ncbi:MAG: tyrosine-type recombinase/integrase [Myxococcota bacterium]